MNEKGDKLKNRKKKGIRPDRIDIFNNWNEWLNRLFFTTNLPLMEGWTLMRE